MIAQLLDLNKQTTSGSMASVRAKVSACMQCGTCSGSCPNAFAMDYTPRQLWRLVQLGQEAEVFESRTFFLCSACYYCTVRCPRGIPLTETMDEMKRIASAKGVGMYKRSTSLYRSFMDTVRRHGRARETELMNRYFFYMKNPLIPFKFAGLGLKLLLKGKVSPELPKLFGEGRFDRMFSKAGELETSR